MLKVSLKPVQKNTSFIPVINFLIGNKIMDMEQAAVLNRNFHNGIPVVFRIADEFRDKMERELKFDGFDFQVVDEEDNDGSS